MPERQPFGAGSQDHRYLLRQSQVEVLDPSPLKKRDRRRPPVTQELGQFALLEWRSRPAFSQAGLPSFWRSHYLIALVPEGKPGWRHTERRGEFGNPLGCGSGLPSFQLGHHLLDLDPDPLPEFGLRQPRGEAGFLEPGREAGDGRLVAQGH